MILPSIKAKYDNHTHFNYTRRKQRYVTRMYTVFYTYLQGYRATIFIALC